MAKKKSHRPQLVPKAQAAPLTETERGRQAFIRNDYDTAITAWTGVLRTKALLSVALALAEAHFRRACTAQRKSPAQALADLKAASDLLPDDAVYRYHLGLAHHRLGDLNAPLHCYRQSFPHNPSNYHPT